VKKEEEAEHTASQAGSQKVNSYRCSIYWNFRARYNLLKGLPAELLL